MRIFIALELPSKAKDYLDRSSSQFAYFSEGGNYVPRQNYHVTLHFLGEVADSDVIFVQSAMDRVAHLPQFELAITQFAMMKTGDLVYAKIKKSPSLLALHEELGKCLEENRFDVEHRAYRPHITLIRKAAFNLPFSEVTKSVSVYNMPFTCSDVVLYQSQLTPKGAVYSELYRVSLSSQQ